MAPRLQYDLVLDWIMGGEMEKVLGLMFVLVGTATLSHAAPNVPEINPAALPTALALLGGGVLVVRAYLKK